MLKCGTAYLRNSCRWHPPWTNKTATSVPQHAKFSAGLPPRTPFGMNSHPQQLFTLGKLIGFGPLAWATLDPWRTIMVPPGTHPCGGLPTPASRRPHPQRTLHKDRTGGDLFLFTHLTVEVSVEVV